MSEVMTLQRIKALATEPIITAAEAQELRSLTDGPDGIDWLQEAFIAEEDEDEQHDFSSR